MKHQYTNSLIHETSPYLLQHAHNPVDWHAWNEEALKKAKEENKLILISIGYSSCHWCHVMEHESFEDSAVAKVMNEHFINIKVDREERPDIDDVYMTACQLTSGGNCGWPLNSFALPDGRPVWAGTYFPKKNWMDVLEYFRKTFEEEPEKLYDYATQLVKGINTHGLDSVFDADSPALSEKDAAQVTEVFLKRIDSKLGGRIGAPKFPMPNNWQYLMHYAKRYDDPESKAAVLVTLDKMLEGGIYDQLEGGFARYSTDDKWLVPHFEKMLYDNGQLISLFAQAFAWTGNPIYKEVVEQTIAFSEEYWLDPSGGFYSSFDADSEGEEGKFYVWTQKELDQLIKDDLDRKIFYSYYDIQSQGNWEHGKNILNRYRTADDITRKFKITDEQFRASLKASHEILLKERKTRIPPGLDDKVLASWNGLMLHGLIEAYKAIGDEHFLELALNNAHFIRKHLMKDDFRLDRNYKNGKSTINAFLDDYASVIQGFLALYQVTFDKSWLNDAQGLTTHVFTHFDGDSTALFYFTSDIDPPLITRRIDISDNVIPSANSMMARNLFTLGEMLYDSAYLTRSEQMLQQVWPLILRDGQPSFYSNWCQLMLSFVQPPYEVAIVGDAYKEKLREIQQTYLPDAIFLGASGDDELPLLKNRFVEGQTLIYVCRNKICKIPVDDPVKALTMLGEK